MSPLVGALWIATAGPARAQDALPSPDPASTEPVPVEEIVVVARDPEPPPGDRVVDRREIQVLPGTNGDVIRAVLNLPGVARPTLGIGHPVIRGTSPHDSGYYLDGARIPLVFHFGGLSTVLNSDAVEQLLFMPGNQGVRYGRILGGAVDVQLEDDLPERSWGYASVDLFQSTLFAEQRIGRRHALTVSGRRSYADVFLNPLLKGRTAFDVRVPRYYDAQVRWLARTRRGSFDAVLLASDDRFQLLEDDAEDGDPTVQLGLATRFVKLRLMARATHGAWHHETSVLGGPERQAFELIDGSAVETPFTVAVRDEWRRDETGSGWSVRFGTDTEVGRYAYSSVLPAVGGIAASEAEETRTWRATPAVYLEPSHRRGDLTVVPGARVDGFLLSAGHVSGSFDPRLAVLYDLGRAVLKASAGGYSQPPTVRQATEEPELGPVRSWQLAVGAQRPFGPALSVEVSAYVNALRQRITGREDAFDFFTGPPLPGPVDTSPYANRGTGLIRGIEGMVKWDGDRTLAWIAATLSRSERIDAPGEEPHAFQYDQPIVLTALGSRALPRGWRLGLRARFTSGNPYPPVVNSYLDAEQNAEVPLFGDPDGARMPPFWSIDARVDKDWPFRTWTLTTYLDLQNATNHRNVELMAWTEDYREEQPILGLPILPAFGVRGSW